MSEWNSPDWGKQWNTSFEIPKLKELAELIEQLDVAVKCTPDFETKGCAFIMLHRDDKNIGRICLSEHESGEAFYTGEFGVNEDDFNGFNCSAIAVVATMYFSELPDGD